MIQKTEKIKDTKHLVGSLPTIRYLDPEFVYIATNNARCPTAEVFVKEANMSTHIKLLD